MSTEMRIGVGLLSVYLVAMLLMAALLSSCHESQPLPAAPSAVPESLLPTRTGTALEFIEVEVAPVEGTPLPTYPRMATLVQEWLLADPPRAAAYTPRPGSGGGFTVWPRRRSLIKVRRIPPTPTNPRAQDCWNLCTCKYVGGSWVCHCREVCSA